MPFKLEAIILLNNRCDAHCCIAFGNGEHNA
jgi:hypothetical protein